MAVAGDTGDAQLAALADRVAARLIADGHRAVTVESCTGGYVAKLLTDIPGSSRWFDCGYVTYSNVAKQRDVGVPADVLLRHGAVSAATVEAMAGGALHRTLADVAVAISGVAGPDGGTAVNPVGSVWFACARREGDGVRVVSWHEQFNGDREAVRRCSAAAALLHLLAAG
jgi:nicotinamide-nucleotide amidase